MMNSSRPDSFATLLRWHRQEARLTQEQLAQRAGLSMRAVSDLERGVKLRPHRTTVQLLAEALGLLDEQRSQFERVAQAAGTAQSLSASFSVPGAATPTTATVARRHNLPFPTSSFVGRQLQLQQLRQLIWKVGVRLVTLTGAGGSGKTRLALELAATLLDDFTDGAYFVDLAPLTEPAEVGPTIAATLGLHETPDRPLLQTLKDYLCAQRMLLLLDNFEHLLEAAPLVTELLEASGGLKVLVTSRISLHLGGEQQYQVPPLDLPRLGPAPTVAQLGQYGAVQLFIERASAVTPAFHIDNESAAAVAEICRRLDGLPLAIELAAAWMQMLTPQGLLARLEPRLKLLTSGRRDLPARQQTLRATIEWSHELLAPAERQLLRRLAVFPGGSTLETIAAVCNADGDLQADVLHGVQSLLNKSLLQQEAVEVTSGQCAPRFVMLETIHEYAREQLQGSGEAEALARQHALYCMRLAEEAEEGEPEVTEAWGAKWLAQLDVEHDNIRAALRWARAPKGSHAEAAEAILIGLRIVGGMWRFWGVRGYYSEGREWLTSLLWLHEQMMHEQRAVTEAERETDGGGTAQGRAGWRAYRARALHGAGVLAYKQGDYDTARTLHEECLALCRMIGDKWGIGYSLNFLGGAAYEQGDYAAARTLLEESLALRREIGHKRGIAVALSNLGIAALLQGDYAAARTLLEESLAPSRETGDKEGIAIALNSLGKVAYEQGDYVAARTLIREGLALFTELGDKGGIASSLVGLGAVAVGVGSKRDTASTQAKGSSGGTGREVAGAGVAQAVGVDRVERAEQAEWAARVLGAAAMLLEELGAVLERAERLPYESAAASARQTLGEEGFERAWQEGRAMSMEQAIAYAR